MNIASQNKSMILNLIRLFSPVSKAYLAEKVGLSITAVSKYTSELMAEGLVEELGRQNSQGGRKASLLGIDNSYGCTLSIDFGHTFVRLGIMDMRSNIVARETIRTKDLGGHKVGIPKLIKLMKSFLARAQIEIPLLAICISPSSLIDNANNTVLFPNLKGWQSVDIVRPIKESFTVPVYCDDCSRMMALAESSIAGRGRERQLVFVNVGDGIGTGVVVNGRPLQGICGTAGELAHIIVRESGYPCDCGSSGCLEQYASVFAMVRNARTSIENGANTKILEYANQNIDQIDSVCIAKAYADNDKLAINILSDACGFLGVGAAIIINMLNPPILVFGGGGMSLSEHMLSDIVRATRLRALTGAFQKTEVRLSRLGDDAGLIGASIFSLDNLFGFYELCETEEFYICAQ